MKEIKEKIAESNERKLVYKTDCEGIKLFHDELIKKTRNEKSANDREERSKDRT